MKKILIFLACILCLSLLIVSCKPKSGDATDADQTNATQEGDINWDDLNGTGNGDEYPSAEGFEVGTDDPNGGWSPMNPIN